MSYLVCNLLHSLKPDDDDYVIQHDFRILILNHNMFEMFHEVYSKSDFHSGS